MREILTFQFPVFRKSYAHAADELARHLSAETPWLRDGLKPAKPGELQMTPFLSGPHMQVSGFREASLWGYSGKPWTLTQAIASADAHPDAAEHHRALDYHFPHAMTTLLELDREKKVRLWDEMHVAPTDEITVIFPVRSYNYHALCPAGQVCGFGFALTIPYRKRFGKPSLGAGAMPGFDPEGHERTLGRNVAVLQLRK